LRRLLFFHGRECYRRNSTVVCYNFFKNISLVLPLFWYGVYNFFSALSLYDAFIYQLYNIFYSSLPIIVYGIFDREFTDDILVENRLNYYLQGIEKKLFNTKVFWSWFIYGTYVSVLLTFLSFQIMETSFVNDSGLTFNFWDTSIMIYGSVVVICNIHILTMSNTYNALSVLCIAGSVGLYPLTLLIYVNFYQTEFSQNAIALTNTEFLTQFVILCACCLPFFLFEAMKSSIFIFFIIFVKM